MPKKHFQAYPTGGIKETFNKRDYTLLPWDVINDIVDVMAYGANKYSRDNWKLVPKEEYLKASLRHLIAVVQNETVDEESGHKHLIHAACDVIYAASNDSQTSEQKVGADV